MTTQEEVFGHWNQLKGKIKESWGQLTDDELEEVEGKFDQLVGLIQQKSGEGRQQIERTIRELSARLGDATTQTTEGVRRYVEDVGETVSGIVDHTRERAQEHLEEAQEMMRRRPAESVAVAFGTGLLIGVVVGLVVRSK
jgi:uncharacterized protein YjbJ (UPF0337 family)